MVQDIDGVTLAAWRNGSVSVSLEEVTVLRDQLVRGWVTICGRVNHLGL